MDFTLLSFLLYQLIRVFSSFEMIATFEFPPEVAFIAYMYIELILSIFLTSRQILGMLLEPMHVWSRMIV